MTATPAEWRTAHSALAVARHRLYRSPLGPRISDTLNPLTFRDSSLVFSPLSRPQTRRSFPLDIHSLKVYIAHRQTCPNCSSSCYANDRICYDSACREIVLHYRVMLSALDGIETLKRRGVEEHAPGGGRACTVLGRRYVSCMPRRARFLAWTTSFRMSALYISVTTRTTFLAASSTDTLAKI